MSSSPAVPEPRNMRASDADRERVANLLREAAGDGRISMEELEERLDAVYAAKTYAELEPVTHDLPNAGAASVPAPRTAPAGASTRFGAEPTSRGAIAIMGGFTRKGDWVVPKDFNVFCLMGGGEIDLRVARFAEREVSIHIVAIMGGCEITVPEDATVRVTGVGIMGAFDHSNAGSGLPDGPVIIVNGLALMGGVDVKRKPLKKSKRGKLQSQLEDADDAAPEARRQHLEARQERWEARRDRLEARHRHHQERNQYRQERRDARHSGEQD